MSNVPSLKRLLLFFGIGAGLAASAIAVYTWTQGTGGSRSSGPTASVQQSSRPNATQEGASGDWQVGQLRPNGLRIKPSGRSDASAVLDPNRFTRPEVKKAYRIAHEIPSMLNKLYCWCGCENRGVHRSNLGCFEDEMAVNCAVCRGTAEIASRMLEDGVTDAGKIQAAVDEDWGPEWAQAEQNRRQGRR
ncbi:MAG TPA: PCYCGC motif-containing (lipo)protein [Salinibacter sp.]|nr:PCYCGC motif-containing (lipo)protein [Salinibacter sp.]